MRWAAAPRRLRKKHSATTAQAPARRLHQRNSAGPALPCGWALRSHRTPAVSRCKGRWEKLDDLDLHRGAAPSPMGGKITLALVRGPHADLNLAQHPGPQLRRRPFPNIAIIVGAVIIQYTHGYLDRSPGSAWPLACSFSIPPSVFCADSSHILLEGRPQSAPGVEEGWRRAPYSPSKIFYESARHPHFWFAWAALAPTPPQFATARIPEHATWISAKGENPWPGHSKKEKNFAGKTFRSSTATRASSGGGARRAWPALFGLTSWPETNCEKKKKKKKKKKKLN